MMKRKKQRGITFLEVLIAMVILSTGLLALIQLQGDLLRHRSGLSQETEALMLVKDKIEGLRYYQVVNTTPGYTAYQDIANGTQTVTKPTATYTLTWTVTNNTAPDYKTITVTASWVDNRNVTQTTTLTSIVGKIDPTTSGNVMKNLP